MERCKLFVIHFIGALLFTSLSIAQANSVDFNTSDWSGVESTNSFTPVMTYEALSGAVVAWPDNPKLTNDERDNVAAVPLPAAFWMFGSALIGFVTLSRRVSV